MFELRNPNDRQENLDILKTDLVFESDMITTLQLPAILKMALHMVIKLCAIYQSYLFKHRSPK